MSEKKLQVDSPVKVITSGTKPTTENLPKGSIAVGRVNNRLAAVAALGDPSEETEAEILANHAFCYNCAFAGMCSRSFLFWASCLNDNSNFCCNLRFI